MHNREHFTLCNNSFLTKKKNEQPAQELAENFNDSRNGFTQFISFFYVKIYNFTDSDNKIEFSNKKIIIKGLRRVKT